MDFLVVVPSAGERLDDREQLAEQLSHAARRKGHIKAATTRAPEDFAVLVDGTEQDEVFKSASSVSALIEGSGYPALVSVDRLFMGMPTAAKPDEWAIAWRTERTAVFTGAKTFGDVRAVFNEFLQSMGRPRPPAGEVPMAMESLASMWTLYSEGLDLSPEDRKVGDSLADTMGQLATVENPPMAVVREIAGWFKRRLDVFADEFAKAAGKTTGHLAGVGISAGLATGAAHVDLTTAVEHLWRLVQ